MIESRSGQFEVDENAMDSSMFNSKKTSNKQLSSTGTGIGSNRNESLIWKPVFNTGNTSEESNECGKAYYDEGSSVTAPPPLSAFSTKSASSEGNTFKSKAIVDYSSNSNDSVSSSKISAVDKEKGTRLSPIPQVEEEQADKNEMNQGLTNVISSGDSSSKVEKKKKKKKNKEKEKEKKHKKNKDKDKDKHKSGADNTGKYCMS